MSKKFEIPERYHSEIIKTVKESRQILDPRKKDLAPSVLDLGPLRFLIPRHFGFCYGVENAIDIAYRTIEQHPGKNIYLLSEIIHNPSVNHDLETRGVRFLYETDGSVRIPIASLTSDDIVIVPAFGTTVEIQQQLGQQGIDPYQYDTTCPFVVKVWKRGLQLGKKGFSLVIHGKYEHEETRATFSHTSREAPCVVVLNVDEARVLAGIMLGKRPADDFQKHFGMKCTPGFDPMSDLKQFGVINQTTMLASETREVMKVLRQAAAEKYGEADVSLHAEKYGEADVSLHFADTSDTLCYATHENQSATQALLGEKADLAFVVGGYNSSNTMHLVELLEERFPTYHIRDASEIISRVEIRHFNQWKKEMVTTRNWIPRAATPITIALTSGASCPDILVDEVVVKLAAWFEGCRSIEEALKPFQQ